MPQDHLQRFLSELREQFPAAAVDAVNRAFLSVIEGSKSAYLDAELHDLLRPSLETKRVFGVDFWTWLKELVPELPGKRAIDFGCGTGRSRGRVEALGLQWQGLDIGTSREAHQR